MGKVLVQATVKVVLRERNRDVVTPEGEAARIGQKLREALANETNADVDVQVSGKDS